MLASVSSLPPGARGSMRHMPEAATAQPSETPSKALLSVHTHWISPFLVRRVRKVIPPMSRRGVDPCP